MKNAKVIIPIRNIDSNLRILQDNLLNDGSINFDDASLEELLKKLPDDEPITKLLHSEVRYEVTDHCNASCIMCPRDEHEHGRAHGIMDQNRYEKSIDEVLTLGAKQIVLTGFGEPMLDKNLELKIAYAKKKGLSTYIISNGSVLNSKRSQKILEAGFLPTKYADSLAIGIGGATFYRTKVNALVKGGMSKAKAEAEAMQEFISVAETSQQSSDQSKISMEQAGPVGKIILAFNNTSSQYSRIIKR